MLNSKLVKATKNNYDVITDHNKWIINSGVTRRTLLMVLYLDRYVPVRVTDGPLVTHRYTYAPPRWRTSQDFCSLLSVPLELSCWPCIRRCGTGEFQEQGQFFFIVLSCTIPTIVFYCFPFSFFLYVGWYRGDGVFGLIGRRSLSLGLALQTSFNNNNNNKIIKND